MKNIEKILEEVNIQNAKIPIKTEYKIQNALKKLENIKIKKQSYLTKLVLTIASTGIIFIGGISAYAAFGGTIQGIPVAEWFGLKFSDKYEDLKVNIDGQELYNGETSVKLASTVCSDGITILEFDVKLSREDKERMHIGEPVVTEEYINDKSKMPNLTMEYNGKKLFPEEVKAKIIEEHKDQVVDLRLSFNRGFSIDEEGNKYIQTLNNFKVIIDGKEYWSKSGTYQKAYQISDYEYKIYQMYFFTEEEIVKKNNFIFSINNMILTTSFSQLGKEIVYIPIDGNYDIEISNNKIVDDGNDFFIKNNEIKYKNIVQKIEKISKTPLFTMIKIKTIISNIKRDDLTTPKSENYIGHFTFKIFDDNGEEINNYNTETQRIITYSDGTKEEWSPGDIGTLKNFYNATLELTDYIVLENNISVNSMVIQPINIKEKYNNEIELDKFFINKKNSE